MNKSSVYAVLAPIVLLLAGFVGYSLYEPGNAAHAPSKPSQQTVDVMPVESDRSTEAGTTATASREAEAAHNLRYVGWNFDSEAESPRACFNFDSNLNVEDRLKMRDYVEIDPAVNVTVDVTGHALCLTGFGFDRDYSVRLKSGLPGQDGKTLSRHVTETVSFGDKPAFVAFAGDGIILPRINSQGVALETVNVDALSVKIDRVSDRMMARRDPQSGKSTLEGDYSWEYRDAAKNIRETLWTGTFDVQSTRNAKVTTVIPVTELTGELSPGAYIITAEREHEESEEQIARAWRWIIVTDLGLTTYQGDDGLTVSVRSLESANLQSGIELTLVAENNDILARTKTDADGLAHFDKALLSGKDPKRAKMVMAYGPSGDYAMLDLFRAPLDLSRFNIGGRKAAGRVDLYGFADRGVYRPGETANFTIMMRDEKAYALTDRPVVLSVQRPNGVEVLSRTFEAQTLKETAGTLVWAYEVPRSAPRGVWKLFVTPEGSERSEKIEFSVEDFVPQTLRLGIKTDETPMTGREERKVSLDAQFLYGAPGAALDAEAEARLRLDPNPFPDYKEYVFGPAAKDFSERFISIGNGLTDGAGVFDVMLDLRGENIETPYPLRAEVTAGVAEPGGRYVRDSVRIPFRARDSYIGVSSSFDGNRVPTGKAAALKLITLDRLGERTTQEVNWNLIEEDWDYHWYRENGRWRYRRDVRDIPMISGTLTTDVQKPVTWSRQLSWGNYRLDVTDENGGVTGYRFSVGWSRAGKADTPDQLQISSNTDAVSPGDNVKLTVNAPYAGQGELVIAGSRLHLIRPVTLKEGGSELSFRFEKEWGESVYAMLTLHTPRSMRNRPVPRRAVGVHYVSLDRSDQTLNVSVDAPAVVRPGPGQAFTVEVDNATRGETVMMSFAAVDEGILQLTKYKSPDAADYFFGKKALGTDIRDDYGRILNPNLGDAAIARTGGDSLGGEGLTVVPTKTVSLFRGPVKFRGGKVRIELDMPQFNGELRLMATAWTDRAVGSASESIKLRDKVPATVSLPRFMAPGDRAFASVSLDNVEGKAGLYEASLVSSGALSADGVMKTKLAQGQRADDRMAVVASETGVETLTLNVSGPQYRAEADYDLQVRAPYMPITRSVSSQIAPGEVLTLSKDMIAGVMPKTADISVSFAKWPGLDPAPYVQSLARYPYGCTEQTVSTAMPLLYAGDLGGIEGQTDADRRRGLNKAISRLVSRQSSDGAFGMWSEGDRYANPWLGVYVTDFLYRADESGLYVSEDVLERSRKALGEISQMPRYSGLRYRYSENNRRREHQVAEAAAYAHYVMARNGFGNLGQMRYVFDNHSKTLQTPLAKAYLAGGLALMGDKRRAKQGFEEALSAAGWNDRRDYYQTPLRDLAGLTAVASEAEHADIVATVLNRLSDELKDPDALNTQEKSYLIQAIKAVTGTTEPVSVKARGVSLTGTDKRPRAQLLGTDLDGTVRFENTGDEAVWATVTVSGVPRQAPEPFAEGFEVGKTVFRPDGSQADLANVKQGERLIIRVAFNSTSNRSRTIVLADLLPAGFEIETILRSEDGARRDGTDGAYKWLGHIPDFAITEARDDRFIASLETYRQDEYVAAYIVRAVTSGDFAMPGAVLEDMYRPADQAVTQSGRVIIAADPTL